MGISSHRKSKRKIKLLNEQIEVYRERDREGHRRRRQGMLNISNVTSSEEEIEFENVSQVIENENVDFESENFEYVENVERDNENVQPDVRMESENLGVDNEGVHNFGLNMNFFDIGGENVKKIDIGGEHVENFDIGGENVKNFDIEGGIAQPSE